MSFSFAQLLPAQVDGRSSNRGVKRTTSMAQHEPAWHRESREDREFKESARASTESVKKQKHMDQG
jgi:hypothetical protein